MWLFKKKKKEETSAPMQPIERLTAPAQINSFRYTYDVWHKENPNRSQLDFESVIYPDNLFMYLTKLVTNFSKKLAITPDTNYTLVPIDDSYFKWVEENNKVDSLNTKGEYCNSLSNDEIYQLMKNNGWEEEYEVSGILVYAVNTKLEEKTKTSYKLEPKLKEGLQEYLGKIYGNDDIYIPGYILTQNDFFQGERDFRQIAKLHFQKNTNVRFIKWEEQQYQNKVALIYPLVIPFAVKRRYESAVLNFDKLLENVKWSPIVSLTKEGLKKFGIELQDFKTTEMFQEIKNYFGPQTIIMESVVRSCDIPDVNRQILSRLVKP